MFNNGHYKVSTGPASEVISLATAKAHLKMDDTDADDALIEAIITAARQHVEQMCATALIQQTITEKFPCFSSRGMALSISPVAEVSAVQYLDGAGTLQTLSTDVYGVNTFTKPGSIYLRYGQLFPLTRDEPNAVTVTYTAGYGEASGDIPKPIMQAILLMVGDMYQNREDTVKRLPTAAEYLLRPYNFKYF